VGKKMNFIKIKDKRGNEFFVNLDQVSFIDKDFLIYGSGEDERSIQLDEDSMAKVMKRVKG
jgi:hypothetical protein